MKIIEESYIENKDYTAKLLNSVSKKLVFLRDHINEDVDEGIIIAEISNCMAMLENAVKILKG